VEALSIKEERLPGRGYLISATGEIDLANVAEFREACARAVNSDALRLTVDLSGVTFMDSTGIAVLVFVYKGVGVGRRLHVVCPAGPVGRVLELLHLDSLLNVVDTADAVPQLV
jgi:anti-sigma B factor antagonist